MKLVPGWSRAIRRLSNAKLIELREPPLCERHELALGSLDPVRADKLGQGEQDQRISRVLRDPSCSYLLSLFSKRRPRCGYAHSCLAAFQSDFYSVGATAIAFQLVELVRVNSQPANAGEWCPRRRDTFTTSLPA